MTAKDRPDTIANPWSARIAVAQIPETGLHRDIEADGATRVALAKIAGLRGIESARASFDLTPKRDDSVHVRGRVSARVGQTCVVSLDPIENDIVEDIDLVFVPESRVRELADSINDDDNADREIPDAPEPIVNGVIDLGRLAADALFLGIDPYPRKPDAVFAPPASEVDPEDHPFAALRALRIDSNSSRRKKPPKDRG
ncbi:YceD family protein [Nitrobacter sp. JJSN]|uniref:YceD family protein n=1 Tax=Nitrobacter sp. JJSN TaxID=3453033 RepID=UPI003F7634F7